MWEKSKAGRKGGLFNSLVIPPRSHCNDGYNLNRRAKYFDDGFTTTIRWN